MSQPSKPTPAKEMQAVVAAVNKSGTELDSAATKIINVIGFPSFKNAMTERPELHALETSRVVDLISASLLENLFAGTAEEEDVHIDLGGEYVSVPASQREVLLSAISRVLATRTAEVAAMLKAKS